MPTAAEMLAKYLDAEARILSGQTFRFGDRMVTRADLAEIRKGRQEWERKAADETAAGIDRPARAPVYIEL